MLTNATPKFPRITLDITGSPGPTVVDILYLRARGWGALKDAGALRKDRAGFLVEMNKTMRCDEMDFVAAQEVCRRWFACVGGDG